MSYLVPPNQKMNFHVHFDGFFLKTVHEQNFQQDGTNESREKEKTKKEKIESDVQSCLLQASKLKVKRIHICISNKKCHTCLSMQC